MMIKNEFYKKSECLITEGTVDFIFRTISLRKLVRRYENIPSTYQPKNDIDLQLTDVEKLDLVVRFAKEREMRVRR